jgi:hypothetical protein
MQAGQLETAKEFLLIVICFVTNSFQFSTGFGAHPCSEMPREQRGATALGGRRFRRKRSLGRFVRSASHQRGDLHLGGSSLPGNHHKEEISA